MSTDHQEADVQPQHEGAGTLFERRYWVDVSRCVFSPEDLIEYVKAHFNTFSPNLLAKFEKTEGAEHSLAVDDEMSIRILGPWNGDVRVTKAEATWFELVTLEGHPEAGTIRFRASALPEVAGGLHFGFARWHGPETPLWRWRTKNSASACSCRKRCGANFALAWLNLLAANWWAKFNQARSAETKPRGGGPREVQTAPA